MNKIWVGIRSNGRPQLISALTNVYQLVGMRLIEGITVVGCVDAYAELILNDLQKKTKVVRYNGNYDLGEATYLLIKDLAGKDLVLFVDDDVLFKMRDWNETYIYIISGMEVVSVLTRQKEISEETIKEWALSNTIELHFSIWKGSVIDKIVEKSEVLKLMKKFKYGGEFYFLTWILKKMKTNVITIGYKDRPLHLFIEDKGSSWRKASLEEWKDLGNSILKADNLKEISSVMDVWNKLIEKRIKKNVT
jgi:hypothetical protein